MGRRYYGEAPADLVDVEIIKCPTCKKNPAKELHTCPFQEDVHDDSTTLCACCDECTHQCGMDI